MRVVCWLSCFGGCRLFVVWCLVCDVCWLFVGSWCVFGLFCMWRLVCGVCDLVRISCFCCVIRLVWYVVCVVRCCVLFVGCSSLRGVSRVVFGV